MKIHKREQQVRDAELEITEAMIKIISKHDLTQGEQIRVVMEACNNSLQNLAKYMIREERHPNNPNKPGGLE